MRTVLAGLVIAITVTAARADEVDPQVMVRIRELYEKKDYAGVKRELLAAYEATQHPSLLFALGQVELNLENYAAAIDYYEKFIATGPAEEQIALAQQAIGAARIRIVTPKPEPVQPPPPRRREWFVSDTIVVAAGGTLALAGAGLFYYGQRLGNDREGTLGDYADRVDRARTLQWTATGMAAVGVLAVGVTIVRWRLRPHDEIVVTPSSVTVSTRW
jgi:tetratricopeptide (TPR) repeat protein